MWTCPKCAEHVVSELDNCWNCGVDKYGVPLSNIDKNIQMAQGRHILYVDTRKGLFFCVIGGILGGLFFYLFQPPPPSLVGEIIAKAKIASEGNSGMHQIIIALTKVPSCYILSGLILFGIAGYIIDKLIGNGNSLLCKISHFISCSDIDKPTAKQIIVKGLPQVIVEHRLGFPLQIITKDSTQIHVYKFIKITFENGKVSSFE